MAAAVVSITGPMQAGRTHSIDVEGPVGALGAETFRDFAMGACFVNDSTGDRVLIRGACVSAIADPSIRERALSWRIRFTPPQSGLWTYQVWFKTGVDAALSDNSGGGADDPAGSAPRAVATLASATPADGLSGQFRIGTQHDGVAGISSGPLRLDGTATAGGLVFARAENRLPARFPVNLINLLASSGAEAAARPRTPGLRTPGAQASGLQASGLEPSGLEASGAASEFASADRLAPFQAADALLAERARLAEIERPTAVIAAPLVFDEADEPITHPWFDWSKGASPDAALAKAARAFDIERLESWGRAFELLNTREVVVFVHLDAVGPPGAAAPWRRSERRGDRLLMLRELVARFGHLNGLVWVGPADADEAAFVRRLDGHQRPMIAWADLQRHAPAAITTLTPAAPLSPPSERAILRPAPPGSALGAAASSDPEPSDASSRVAPAGSAPLSAPSPQSLTEAATAEPAPAAAEAGTCNDQTDAPAADPSARATRARRRPIWSIASMARKVAARRRADASETEARAGIEDAQVIEAKVSDAKVGDAKAKVAPVTDGQLNDVQVIEPPIGDAAAAKRTWRAPSPAEGSPVASHKLAPPPVPRRRWMALAAARHAVAAPEDPALEDPALEDLGPENPAPKNPALEDVGPENPAPKDATLEAAVAPTPPRRRFEPGVIAAARQRDAAPAVARGADRPSPRSSAPPAFAPARRDPPAAQDVARAEGGAQIELQLYLLASSERSARPSSHPKLIGQAAPHAEEIDIGQAVDIGALSDAGAALIARPSGADVARAGSIRLSIGTIDAPECWADMSRPVEPAVLFDGLQDAARAVAAAEDGGPAMATFRIYTADDADSASALKTWRCVLERAASDVQMRASRARAKPATPRPSAGGAAERGAPRGPAAQIWAAQASSGRNPASPSAAVKGAAVEAPAIQNPAPAPIDRRPVGLARALAQVNSARAERLRKGVSSGLQLVSLDILEAGTSAPVAAVSDRSAITLRTANLSDLALRAVFAGPQVDRTRHVRVRVTALDAERGSDRRRARRVLYQAVGSAIAHDDGVVANFDDFTPPRGRAALWLEALDSAGAPLLQMRLTVSAPE